MCVGEAAAHGAKKPHAREVLFDALSLLPMGGEKNLEGMGEVAIHEAKSLHTREHCFQNRTRPGGRTVKTGNRDENRFFKPKESDFLLIL